MSIRAFSTRLLASLLLLGASLASQAAQTLTIAVVPQFLPEQIFSTWTPVLNEVTKLTGIRFELKSYTSIPEFEAAFLKGIPDVVYLNPYHAVMAGKAQGYVPIIRDNRQRLKGILVVRKDSAIATLNELEGGNIAFPAPNAFGASLYMRALLSEDAKIHFTPVYVKTHSNVFRHVLSGRALAGGAVQQTLDTENPEVQAQLRILYETPAVYPHPIAVHPRVPPEIREALQKAFAALAANGRGNALLDAIQIPSPVKASYSEYAPLEKLGLERYVVLKGE